MDDYIGQQLASSLSFPYLISNVFLGHDSHGSIMSLNSDFGYGCGTPSILTLTKKPQSSHSSVSSFAGTSSCTSVSSLSSFSFAQPSTATSKSGPSTSIQGEDDAKNSIYKLLLMMNPIPLQGK